MKREPRKKFLVILVASSFFTVILRAFTLQIRSHSKLKRLSEIQSIRSVIIKGPRGPIIDAGGKYLAISTKSYSVYVVPHLVKDKKLLLKRLGAALGMSRKSIRRKLRKKGFVWIKRRLGEKEAQKIRKIHIRGVGLVPEYRREYPMGNLFRCVIGMVGSELQGLSGMELSYDDILKEKTVKKERVLRDARGYLVSLNPHKKSLPDVEGLKLTLDSNAGTICEEELQRAVKKYRAKSAMAIVMNPKTGAILSMASYPPCKDPIHERCPVCSKLIEPGSTIKPFILARALERGILSKETPVKCPPILRVSGKTIHDVHPHKELTAEDVVVYSSNIGISQIALKLGGLQLKDLFQSLRFGKGTGIDMPGEEPGILGSFKRDVDIACKSFGQGMSITLLELTNAFSVFATGGFITHPHIASEIVDEDGNTLRRIPFPPPKRVLKEWVANTMRIILRKVVAVGTGKRADIEGYSVCGKTGTSQKLVNGRYSSKKFYSIFVGFFPMEDPVLLIGVLVDEPKKGHYGGEVAAPTFKRIAERLITYYGIKPTSPVKVAELIPSTSREGKPVRAGEKILHSRMPDLRGLTPRAALEMISDMDVDIKILGKGSVVVSQKPFPGKPKRYVKTVILRLGWKRK